MMAFLSIKYHEDQSNRGRIESISKELEKLGYDTFCVVRDIERWGEVPLSAEALMQRTFEAIETCDIVVVDLTEKGVGAGIEAGYACAKGKPVITIAQSGSDISTTLRGISTKVAWYKNYAELPLLLSHLRR